MMLRMNLMFRSLAHFIIFPDRNFLTKLVENINSLKALVLIQKFCSFLVASIHLFVDQLHAAFVFVVMNYIYQTLYHK